MFITLQDQLFFFSLSLAEHSWYSPPAIFTTLSMAVSFYNNFSALPYTPAPPTSTSWCCCCWCSSSPRSQQWLGRGQHPGVQHPGSDKGSSCPSNCSRWGRGQPGRPRHRWCRAFSPAGSWAGRTPWTWSGWTTELGSAAWGWAAQGAAIEGNTLSLFGRRQKMFSVSDLWMKGLW